MGFSDFSRRPYQFKSMSLGSIVESFKLCNDVTEDKSISFLFSHVPSCSGRFQGYLRDVDRLMKRAERDAIFSEVVAGIVVQFKQMILPVAKNLRIWGAGVYWGSLLCTGEDVYRAELFVRNQNFLLQDLLAIFVESLSSGLESAHKVVVSALALLSFVYQYLIGCVDKGGSKTYSLGSFLFRLIFVAIVLFLGSYVWIKSRQASFTANRRKRKLEDQSDVPEGVYRRAVKDSRGSVTHYRYEPRFKPRRENPESGTPLKFNCLSLGSYGTSREAELVRHIAAVLYGKEEGRPVQFEGGLCLPFPSVTEPVKCPPSGKEKAVWVTQKTKQLYAELLKDKASRLQFLHPAVEAGSHHGHRDGESSRSDPSPSAPGAPSTAIELTCFTPPHGGNGVEEPATTSGAHGLGQEPALAREEFPAFFSDSELEQIFLSMLEENDLPAMDGLNKVVGDNSETDNGFDFESTLVLPQSSALDNPTTAIFASLPQAGGRGQGLEIIESHLHSATAITFQQLESFPEQVQLQVRVACQEQRPEEFAESNVELQQKLLESEVRNSELQQELRKSEVDKSELQQKLLQSEIENEKWRSMFRQLAKLI